MSEPDWSAEVVKLRGYNIDLTNYLNARDYDNAQLVIAEYRVALGNLRLLVTERGKGPGGAYTSASRKTE